MKLWRLRFSRRQILLERIFGAANFTSTRASSFRPLLPIRRLCFDRRVAIPLQRQMTWAITAAGIGAT
jgi:hypothetical protein